MTKSRGILAPRRAWSELELELLTKNYSDSNTDDIARVLDRPTRNVYAKAAGLGLSKSEAYLASEASGRIQRGKQNEAMRATQFKKGFKPWNKGTKGLVGVQEACRATQFKKGRPAHEARNYVPIGTLRINRDGYLERKVTDDHPVPARRWVSEHRLVWEAANGPVPDGHVVVFLPGRRTAEAEAITLDALELVSRVELMRRNSFHNRYPKEVGLAIQLRGALTKQINKRAKETA